MKSGWTISLSVLGGVLGTGLLLLINSPPRGEPVSLLPPPTPAPLTIHVTGAVLRPGVFSLPADSRVQDAIQTAGGFMPNADDDQLNLAARLEDGQKIQVTFVQPKATKAPTTSQADTSAGAPPTQAELIDINTASTAELEQLPGIGPVKARRIVEYRQANGPFDEIADIQNVSGIGPATFAALEELITVGNFP